MTDSHRLILVRFPGTLVTQVLGFYGFFQAYSETRSPVQIGLLGIAMVVPTVILGLKVGAWVDSMKRIGSAYLCSVVLGFLPILLCLFFERNYFALLGALALVSLIRTGKGPLYYAMLKNFSSDPGRVAKLTTLSWQVPLVLGSFIVSSFHSLGIGSTGIVVLLCLLQLGSVLLVFRYRGVVRSQETQVPAGIFEAVRKLNILERKKLFCPLFADTVLTGFLGLSALLPFLLAAKGGESLDFGYFKSIFHMLSFVPVLFLPSRILARGATNNFIKIVFLWSLGVAALTVFDGPVAVGLIMGSLGALDGMSAVIRENLMYSLASDGELGLISSINSLLISTGDELGEFNTGMMVGSVGVTKTVILSSALSFLVALHLKGNIGDPGSSSR